MIHQAEGKLLSESLQSHTSDCYGLDEKNVIPAKARFIKMKYKVCGDALHQASLFSYSLWKKAF